MKAIPTTYRGTLFRSKLEAQWAEFFDMNGVKWLYEVQGYEFGGVRYLPDFLLPLIYSRGKPGGVHFEVKPIAPTPQERHKAQLLANGTGRPVIVSEQSPGPFQMESLQEFVGGDNGWQDAGLIFARCDNCGQVDIGFYASDEPSCPCGKDTFNPYNGPLETARKAFPNLGRWEKAA